MKISLEWLSEYLPGAATEIGAERAADALMNGGLPVETTERVGDDTVIDVEVTSNRSDCLSHAGVPRELAAPLGRELRGVIPGPACGGKPSADATSVSIEAPDLCPYYSARIIRGVKV